MKFNAIRLAAVQAAPVFLDWEKTTEKACRLIRQASENGASIVGFPEGFIPTHPSWFEILSLANHHAISLSKELFKNAVEVPGPATEMLCQARRDAGIAAVVGINERRPHTTGSLFNTQLFIDSKGSLALKHQKLVPTIGERLVHMPGTTGTSTTFTDAFGTVSGLICGENSNPLAQYAAALKYPVVHVASWPAHFNPDLVMQDVIPMVTRALAYTLKCFVINSVAVVDDLLVAAYGPSEYSDFLREAGTRGGASIIAPSGNIIAGPAAAGETIVYADVDLADVIIPKMIHDFAGHYNRPDLFANVL